MGLKPHKAGLEPAIHSAFANARAPLYPFGIQGAEAQAQYHAFVAAYTNDFMLMFWVCLRMLAHPRTFCRTIADSLCASRWEKLL